MVGHTSASRFVATMLLVGAVWVTFQGNADACVKWSRAKGTASCLHSSAEKLRKRIECLEDRGLCTQIAMQLERATCELKEAISHDADWVNVECALRDVKRANMQLVNCVSRICLLRDDRRVDSELERFQDYLCKVQDQLRVSLEKLGGLPQNRPSQWNQPYGNPREVDFPWIQQQGAVQIRQHGNQGGSQMLLDGFIPDEREYFQPPQPNANGYRPMTLPGYSPAGAPQIRVQNNELGKEMLKLVLSRVLQ